MTLSRKAYRLKGLFLAVALTAQAAAGAVLTGVVRGEDGKVVPGLRVTAIGIFAGASGTFSASSGSDGKYSMLNIPPGRYEVCAAAPSSDYLDSCFWAMPELSPIIVTASSQAVSRDLVVKRAGKITLRLNDNANLLDGRTPNGKAGGGHVMMGILTPKGL